MVPCNAPKNTIFVPGLALAAAMPARRELLPLSLRFVTVKVLSNVRSSNTSKRGMNLHRELTALRWGPRCGTRPTRPRSPLSP